MEKFALVLPDAQSTRRLGAQIGKAVSKLAWIALQGPLGAGKTTLVQGMAVGLDIPEVVSSPTFTMLNEYHSGRLPLYHLDLYRYKDVDGSKTAAAAGLLQAELEELTLGSGLIVMEWAEIVPGLLAEDHLLVELDYAENGEQRRVEFTASGSSSYKLVEQIKVFASGA